MKNYEKKSFIQIFLSFFVSVSIFVILLGYLYFEQQKVFVIQKNAMNMHQYILKLKQSNFTYIQKNYSYEFINDGQVKQQLPLKVGKYYVKVFSKRMMVKVDASIIDNELKDIRIFTIMLQIFLVIFFAIISYFLARKSLKPMSDTISHMDRFTKDLIHDLNTPISSILINTNMLKKDASENSLKKINRIENSAKNISSLYANLEILLDEKHIEKSDFDLSNAVSNSIDTYKSMYSNIDFEYTSNNIQVNSNENAVKRIIDNIISNACKYSKDDAKIQISYIDNTLTIKDNGKGIKYPKKIFERAYKEDDNGHGIGMHIVYRLCSLLHIDINIESKQNEGTTIKLTF
ncbi:MAG TPA: HAMP domain-containing histidine kinase [Arcobacter sp.]|nr:HAMP domain-containing histidine kinase [Arcobacter sp.]HIP55467.1 HAMP domain-containing histidine kinase [Arcobacter sp.]